ncbi:urea carboxylase [Dietzia kunjamensis]|jgi:urea carboxylase|uniref:5-oxoprolinase/urea amidolyase family protein n=1 Tax=Dietzia kunjamensis TaxID=322509 RepID=UPI000E7267E7|nr:5-oxoprolinase/urea amidolyase family protein [Dietzia kunjamensis]MBB1013426.1 5-oxoprolinase/urea amidolyase family protein [Dietzia kunjamensis]RKE54791.1 urea carboxylase [Dietzia kunjamensis]USX46061.1 5-oxoprolinase/urea amidolyase family protein [Dietzia kunjamensis]
MTRLEILAPGLITTVQDWPARIGYWGVGVPPSGAMDDQSLRLANIAVGNPEGAAGLECTRGGLRLRADGPVTVCVGGAHVRPTVTTGAENGGGAGGQPVAQWKPVTLEAGSVLDIPVIDGPGMRVYVAVRGGIDVEQYLGSSSTFTLGRFGGHEGRALAAGDTLEVGEAGTAEPRRILADEIPAIGHHWHVAVAEGPHGAPEFLTRAGMDELYAATYTVHFNSDRTGVRLEGPRPKWARPDGGEAGLHPSNLHDNAYSVGALDFTGDTPILLGPDGPSLGGFVCPVTVVSSDRWKLGQLAPGDTVRFVRVRVDSVPGGAGAARGAGRSYVLGDGGDRDDGVLGRGHTADGLTEITYRRGGDDNVLVEYGRMELDLELRARAHALYLHLLSNPVPGQQDLTPGIRSLQVKITPGRSTVTSTLAALREAETALPAAESLVVPSRRVRLPLSWDDPATREAIERYMYGVRDDAPWCPWNIEFIRRMNGLETADDVYRTVFDAEYMVLGLGDVYLGAPVATPLDPRHRLVTTKYNPARTWTAENSVGIGGAYLCIYGMEGPGGYQFVGRTTQVWNHRHPEPAPGFDAEHPWLLRHFDRISWYPVTSEELTDLRADTAAGRGRVDITDDTFSLAEHNAFCEREAESIASARRRMEHARSEEFARWAASGELSA